MCIENVQKIKIEIIKNLENEEHVVFVPLNFFFFFIFALPTTECNFETNGKKGENDV